LAIIAGIGTQALVQLRTFQDASRCANDTRSRLARAIILKIGEGCFQRRSHVGVPSAIFLLTALR
jgi:hypothetical protein